MLLAGVPAPIDEPTPELEAEFVADGPEPKPAPKDGRPVFISQSDRDAQVNAMLSRGGSVAWDYSSNSR
jgi:hypothetical protein